MPIETPFLVAGELAGCGRAFLQHTPVQALLGLHPHQKFKQKSLDEDANLTVGFYYTPSPVVAHFMHHSQWTRTVPHYVSSHHLHNMFLGKSLDQCTEQWRKVQEMWALPFALLHRHPAPGSAAATFFPLTFSSLAQLNWKLSQTWVVSYAVLATCRVLEHKERWDLPWSSSNW